MINKLNLEVLHTQIFSSNGDNIGLMGDEKGVNSDDSKKRYLLREVFVDKEEVVAGNSHEEIEIQKLIEAGEEFELEVGKSKIIFDGRSISFECEKLIFEASEELIINGEVIDINGKEAKAEDNEEKEEDNEEKEENNQTDDKTDDQLESTAPVVGGTAVATNQSDKKDDKDNKKDDDKKEIVSVKFDKEQGSLFEPFNIIIKTKNIDEGITGIIELTDDDGIFKEEKIEKIIFRVKKDETTIKIDLLKNINDVITLIKEDEDKIATTKDSIKGETVDSYDIVRDEKIEIKVAVKIDGLSEKSEKPYKLDRNLKPNLIPTGYIVQAIRPLGGVVSMENGVLNKANIEILHEQIFLGEKENIGFLGQDKGLNEDKGDISLYLARKVIKADSNKIWEAVKVVAKRRWEEWEIDIVYHKAYQDSGYTAAMGGRLEQETESLYPPSREAIAKKWRKEQKVLEGGGVTEWEGFHLGFNKLTYELFGYNCQAFVEDVLKTYKESKQ